MNPYSQEEVDRFREIGKRFFGAQDAVNASDLTDLREFTGKYIDTITESSGVVGTRQTQFIFTPTCSSGQLIKNFKIVANGEIEYATIEHKEGYLLERIYGDVINSGSTLLPFSLSEGGIPNINVKITVEFKERPGDTVDLQYDICEYTGGNKIMVPMCNFQKANNTLMFNFNNPVNCLVGISNDRETFYKPVDSVMFKFGDKLMTGEVELKLSNFHVLKSGEIANIYEFPYTINFSRLEKAMLLSYPFERLYARNTNVLKIVDGLAGPMFSH